jgi:predicted molibdopterin-dependent oxidoreductase YjgC
MPAGQSIIIDGKKYVFEDGETILQVALRNGIRIPTLCCLQGATPTGACRLCLVEVTGAKGIAPACATPAAPRMVICTMSEQLIQLRRLNLQMLLASGHHHCETCEADGDCKLQALASEYKIDKLDFKPTPVERPTEINTLITRDFSRCILCGRCVQACNEVQVNQAIAYGYRGVRSRIVASDDRPYAESDCVFCGECVRVCPVGSLVETQSRFKGKPWETEKTRTTCGYCGVGCQIHLHVKDRKIIKVTGVDDRPPNYGSLCIKGRFAFDFIHSSERLQSPLVRSGGSFREASWDEALALIASKLQSLIRHHGPDSIAMLSSARITNEDNFVAQKFARAVIGTNNIDHCARL